MVITSVISEIANVSFTAYLPLKLVRFSWKLIIAMFTN